MFVIVRARVLCNFVPFFQLLCPLLVCDISMSTICVCFTVDICVVSSGKLCHSAS